VVIFREAAGPCTVDNKTRCKNRKLLQNEVNSKTGTVTSPKRVWILAPWGPQQVQTLPHRCDSNAVFIVDVSRVYAISSSEDGMKQNQSVHTHCISEIFQSGTRKKGYKMPWK